MKNLLFTLIFLVLVFNVEAADTGDLHYMAPIFKVEPIGSGQGFTGFVNLPSSAGEASFTIVGPLSPGFRLIPVHGAMDVQPAPEECQYFPYGFCFNDGLRFDDSRLHIRLIEKDPENNETIYETYSSINFGENGPENIFFTGFQFKSQHFYTVYFFYKSTSPSSPFEGVLGFTDWNFQNGQNQICDARNLIEFNGNQAYYTDPRPYTFYYFDGTFSPTIDEAQTEWATYPSGSTGKASNYESSVHLQGNEWRSVFWRLHHPASGAVGEYIHSVYQDGGPYSFQFPDLSELPVGAFEDGFDLQVTAYNPYLVQTTTKLSP